MDRLQDHSVISVDGVDEEVHGGVLHGGEAEVEFCGGGGGHDAGEGGADLVVGVAVLELLDAAEGGEEVVGEVVGAV